METDTTSGGGFPDLISAALLGAGISGDDLALDFDDVNNSAIDDPYANANQNGTLEDGLHMPVPANTSLLTHSNGQISDPSVQLNQQHQQQVLQVVQPPQRVTAHIINPPHLKGQSAVLQQPTRSPVIKTTPQNVRVRTVGGSNSPVSIPQGVQSFRIVRAQTSQPQNASGSTLLASHTGQAMSGQMASRLTSVTSPQVITSALSTPSGSGGNRNVGLKKIIHIPSSAGANFSQGQFIIQTPTGNGSGPSSKVVKVTSTSGKQVCPEEITKIVNSLPNLKSGSKIIVNSTLGTHSKTIQLVTKAPPSNHHSNQHLPIQVTSPTISRVINPALNVLPVQQQLSHHQPVIHQQHRPLRVAPYVSRPPSASPIVNPNISRLPFTPITTHQQHPHHKVGHLGQLGALSSLALPPAPHLQTIPDKVLIPKDHSRGQKGLKHGGPASLRQSFSHKDLTKGWNDANFMRKSHSVQNFLQTFGKAPPDEEEIEEESEELGHAETYAEYVPRKLNFGRKHPDAVVETNSLSSVEPPDIRYQLRIVDEGVDDEGKLSALQLESITYACQRNMTILPNGERAGYLVGDGAGVGKGRTIAGIIFENYLHRRKRALWLSVSNDLRVDAVRDLHDIGADHIGVYPLNKFKYYSKISSKENNSCKKGVIFATYSSLIGESQADGKYNTRLKQLLKWLGHDFEGVIVFDECHKAKNLCPTGSSKPTKTGQTVLELQNRLPKARVVYASATGASEPKNMAYMTRLGLWGDGTPFKDFGEFIQAVERRGVGAMELVAMDAKLRGMYIARQLSFHGVSFRIDEIPLEKDFIKVYNLAVEMWVEARELFQQAAELVDAEHRMKKSMWGQFWSAHQRFFKYLCISSKVNRCVDLAREAVNSGKCVVIGLQSTGEARMLEQVDEAGGDLSDFVSTAKGVFQSLVEKHFPASTRGRALDIIKRVSNSHNRSNSPDTFKRKKENDYLGDIKKRAAVDSSDPESNDSDSSDIDGIDFISSSSSPSSNEEEGHNPFANGLDSDDDDPWCQKKRKRKESPPKKKKKVKKRKKDKPSKHDSSGDEDAQFDRAMAKAGLLNKPPTLNGIDGSAGNWEKAGAMKSEILSRIEYLGERLPPNTLDQLIDELGGTDYVAEMTGRKSRVVSTNDGVQFESRSESDVPLEVLNLTEKQRFMDCEKCIAIISEAASSGISLQADRRAINQKRRVHITLELPWSADRAIQQFGRTHRSNQVSAPEYVFLISELAGERRFAATVAKRLESLGALTHGDRRATESRDLSRFNIDNRYGRLALETIMKSVLGLQQDNATTVPPPDYPGDFFKDVKQGLIGVGMINIDEKTGIHTLEKDFNNISKFLNRILGMRVAVQNSLFKYFTETLTAIILEAKRNGRWDMGILDLGSGEEKVRKIETKVFVGNTVTNTAKTELSKFAVERGMAWSLSMELWRRCGSLDEGFYCSTQDRNLKKMIILAVIQGKNKKKELMFNVYRPNTGLQNRCETLEEIRKKYKKCLPDVAQPLWEEQYTASETQCSHKYWKGGCRKAATGQACEFGLRTRFYWVLSGSVLSVWSKVESVLVSLNSSSRMQIIRLRTEDNQRIVGSLIPSNGVLALEGVLRQGSAKTYTEKFDNPFNHQPYIPGASAFNNRVPNHKPNNVSSVNNSSSSVNRSIHASALNNIGNTTNHGNHATTSSNSDNDSKLQNGKQESSPPEETEKPEILSMPTFAW